jgi:hypothetical protein
LRFSGRRASYHDPSIIPSTEFVDDLDTMFPTHDRFCGRSGLALERTAEKPTGYKGLNRGDLTAVPMNDGE